MTRMLDAPYRELRTNAISCYAALLLPPPPGSLSLQPRRGLPRTLREEAVSSTAQWCGVCVPRVSSDSRTPCEASSSQSALPGAENHIHLIAPTPFTGGSRNPGVLEAEATHSPQNRKARAHIPALCSGLQAAGAARGGIGSADSEFYRIPSQLGNTYPAKSLHIPKHIDHGQFLELPARGVGGTRAFGFGHGLPCNPRGQVCNSVFATSC